MFDTRADHAKAEGLSDGYHGYDRNPRDFTGDVLAAYDAGFKRGREISPFNTKKDR